jgi:dihydroxyacetone kinase-like protein
MEAIDIRNGQGVLANLIDVIHANSAYLSEIDGAIGDGDHGINMDKGFQRAGEILKGTNYDLSRGFEVLGTVLLEEIGGSMGPIYGTIFLEFSDGLRGKTGVDLLLFGELLDRATRAVQELGGAALGDKTILDCLIPADLAFSGAAAQGKSFIEALQAMKAAAEEGKENTREMIARVGRASRLGERSKGVQDAGATSCNLILQSLGDSFIQQLAA